METRNSQSVTITLPPEDRSHVRWIEILIDYVPDNTFTPDNFHIQPQQGNLPNLFRFHPYTNGTQYIITTRLHFQTPSAWSDPIIGDITAPPPSE